MADLDQIHRAQWARVVAVIARAFRDLDLAEEAAAEAFSVAVERWPVDGMPDNPGAWLVAVARNKAIDRVRREAARGPRQAEAQRALIARADDELVIGPLGDDRLRLMFTCCHPALSAEARIALTLRMVAGLSTAEVARAFWVPEATMAQRLVRAKRKIATARIPYRVPEDSELPDRLSGVLRVVYLVFREGYTPSGGAALARIDLCDEAIRLARLLIELLPDEGEVLGLLSLLLLHHSRRATRANLDGDPILLADQDRRLWDVAAIREGAALAAAALRHGRRPYALQAGIAACHATAPSGADVNWRTIAALYAELARLDPSPAILLHRAVAVAETDGPAAGLAMVDSLLSTPDGSRYATASHHPHVARADLLRRLDRRNQAADAYRHAAQMASTDPERRFLANRAAELRAPPRHDA